MPTQATSAALCRTDIRALPHCCDERRQDRIAPGLCSRDVLFRRPPSHANRTQHLAVQRDWETATGIDDAPWLAKPRFGPNSKGMLPVDAPIDALVAALAIAGSRARTAAPSTLESQQIAARIDHGNAFGHRDLSDFATAASIATAAATAG
jgi:hypothetical protein